MLGVEFVKDRETKEPNSELVSNIINYAAHHGLLLEAAGVHNNVIRFLCPLCVTDAQLEKGLEIFEEAIKACIQYNVTEVREMIHEQIDNIIKTKVNPVLADHFGSATLTKYENKIAYVKLNGTCASCPSAQDTLELTIKEIILKELPEVSDVKLDTSVSEDILDMARKILNISN